jgi:predicted DNA-binding transcriptional regulator AlpA
VKVTESKAAFENEKTMRGRKKMESTTIPPVTECQLGSALQISELIGISRVTLWRLQKTGGFPRPIRLLPNNPRSRLRFRLSEIRDWLLHQQTLSIDATDAAERLDIHLSR